MASGLLALRKLQLRTLYATADTMSLRALRRAWAHDAIRLAEFRMHGEEYEDAIRLTLAGDRTALLATMAAAHDATQGLMTCAHCAQPPRGFRTKYHVAVWHILGLCQQCQDAGPDSRFAPER